MNRSRPAGRAFPTPSRRLARNPEAIADHGIEAVTRHYAAIIEGLAEPPVLVGHSFGGMIA